MRIALAQLNPTIGDLSGNLEKIRTAAATARKQGAELLVTPELCVSGYPPRDLLLRQGFVEACDEAVAELASITDESFGILVGHPTHRGAGAGRMANAASLLAAGTIRETVHKVLLPNYDVFDEKRYFQPGHSARVMEFRGLRLGVHICEDAWWGEPNTFYHDSSEGLANPIAQLADEGADLFINLSASPFELGKRDRRRRILRRHLENYSGLFLLVNQVGGNDDLVFDGHSLVIGSDGRLLLEGKSFDEDLLVLDTTDLPRPHDDPKWDRPAMILQALTLGLRDYMRKCGFSDCVLGLSGGIDSALAACVAARAVGPEHVHGIMMPSRYSSDHSVADSEQLGARLGIDVSKVPIDSIHKGYEALPVIGEDLLSNSGGLADQNLQARIRGAIVMTRSNRHGWIALATGNKSELAVGYCTLYGDMAGGFAVLSDLYKRDVYGVARYINESAGEEIIPTSIIEKAPSAELAPGQFDQETLPPYDLLDGVLEGLIDGEKSPRELSKEFPPDVVAWVVQRLDRNEFKRRQMPPGIKVTQRAFGSGRRMPMAARIQLEWSNDDSQE